ncbi:MAG: Eco57I restriction-modification methylase domain-containing protein, partial [Methanosarcinales archaeon]
LVEATDYLANSLIEAYGKTDKELEEDDIILARREVVEKCIYGVDINPLAVELAKLSLWLHTISKNRSLAFLDHHIKCGNSLIGAEIKDLSKPLNKNQNNQLTLFSSAFKNKIETLLEKFAIIEKIPSNTPNDLKEKEKHYKEFNNIVQRFKEVANIWMSTYFGNEISSGKYNAIQSKLLSGETEWNNFKDNAKIKKAIEIAKENKFFHWELEFPEVFFENSEKKVNAGFDAVIGNPPYARERDNKSLFAVVKNTPIGLRFYEGKMDYWYFFLHKAIELSKNKISFIVPHYWLSSTGAKKLLERIRKEVYFEKIVDFGKFKVFPSASGQHNIFVFSKYEKNSGVDIQIIKDSNLTKEELNNAIYGISEKGILRLLLKNQEDLFDPYGKINLEAPKYINLLNKIEKEKLRLSDLAEVNQGIVQGPDKVTSRNVSKVAKELGITEYEFLNQYQINIGDGIFVLNNSELSNLNLNEVEKSLIKPFFEPSQIRRFYCFPENYEWIIYSTKKTIKKNPNYPNLQKHLQLLWTVLSSP